MSKRLRWRTATQAEKRVWAWGKKGEISDDSFEASGALMPGAELGFARSVGVWSGRAIGPLANAKNKARDDGQR